MDSKSSLRWRLTKDLGLRVAMTCALVWMILPLLSVLWSLWTRGSAAINVDFFLKLPVPPGSGEATGMANAMVGSALMLTMAFAIAAPLGLALGVFLSEYDDRRLSRWMLPFIEGAASFPSILVGLVVFSWVVRPFGGFSAVAGAVALGFLMIPLIAKGTFTILQEYPTALREAGLALGISRWRVITKIVLPESLGSLATVLLLALARVAGETAPLLFTSFGNQFWNLSPFEPMASMPVQIYNYAVSPYPEWHTLAWGAALVLIIFVFLVNLSVRLVMKRNS
jgi:phosphate transport system permease protein